MKSIMVVCNVYKLMRNGTSYVKNGMLPERTNVILRRDYAEQKNEKWQKNGLWHEIDEDATNDSTKLAEKERLNKIETRKAEGKLNELMIDVLKKGSSSDESSEEVSDKKSLRAKYKKLYGKNAFNGWDADKLKEKINAKTK